MFRNWKVFAAGLAKQVLGLLGVGAGVAIFITLLLQATIGGLSITHEILLRARRPSSWIAAGTYGRNLLSAARPLRAPRGGGGGGGGDEIPPAVTPQPRPRVTHAAWEFAMQPPIRAHGRRTHLSVPTQFARLPDMAASDSLCKCLI